MRSFHLPAVAVAVAGAALVLAACGSSSPKSSSTATTSAPSGATSGSSGGAAAYTVQTASVPKVGTVLVNGSGRTLYLLTSEKGGKVTCTAANGCTNYWPPAELPSGVTHGVAGTGAEASLLNTVSSGGHTFLTYAGYPLYTYSGDTGPGTDNGQGVVSFGGTWWAINPMGAPVTSSSSSGPTSTTSGSGYGSGGGY